jgi:hypothetical protein
MGKATLGGDLANLLGGEAVAGGHFVSPSDNSNITPRAAHVNNKMHTRGIIHTGDRSDET